MPIEPPPEFESCPTPALGTACWCDKCAPAHARPTVQIRPEMLESLLQEIANPTKVER